MWLINLLFGDVIKVRKELIESRKRNNGHSCYLPLDADPDQVEIEVRRKVREYMLNRKRK